MVMERVGQVEARWSALRQRAPEVATYEAVERLRLLQRALRRRLLDRARKPFALSQYDPLGQGTDFTVLDTMVDALWQSTETLGPAAMGAGRLPQPCLPKPLLGGRTLDGGAGRLLADVASPPPGYTANPAEAAASWARAC